MLTALFIAGLAFGVLVNSLADNLPPDELGVRHRPRRPHCRRCGRTHRPAFWLGLVAWLARQGRCEYCGGRRRLRTVVIEIVTGLSLAYLWLWAADRAALGAAAQVTLAPALGWDMIGIQGIGPTLVRFLPAAVLVVGLLLIAVIDIEHRLILRLVALPAAALAALAGWATPGHSLAGTLLGGAAAYGIMLGLYLLAGLYGLAIGRLRGRPLDEVALGGGDVNLALVIGLAVGWPGILVALMITVLAGGAFSLVVIVTQLVRRRYSPHMVMPYGPFLIIGALAVYLYGPQVAAVLAGQ
jgi:leader peptidase (prepilin peptidase) / N-methyltransferase